MICGLDARGLLYRAFFAGQGREPQRTLERFASIVRSVTREVAASHAVLAWESGPSNRRDLLPGYKLNRKPAPTALRSQAAGVPAWAREQGIPVVEVAGWEADDVLASAAREAVAAGEPITIVSSDKDLLQLLRPGVFQWRPDKANREDRLADQFTCFREWRVPPARIPDLFGLMGDATDGIPGVPGLGLRKAQRLLDRYGSLDAVLAAPQAGDRDAALVVQHADEARLCRDVATLNADLGVGRCWSALDKPVEVPCG